MAGRALRVHQPMWPVGLQALAGQRDQLARIQQQPRPRHPPEGHAHAIQSGAMVRLRIIQHRHEARRRALPAQREPGAPCPVRITQQRPLGQRHTVDASHAFDQRRARHWQQPFVEQRLHHQAWPLPAAQPQRGVELALPLEINQAFTRLQVDLDLWVLCHEVTQARHQPGRRHRRYCADRQHVLGTCGIGLEGFVDRIQMRTHLVEQALALQGEGDTTRLADQQRLPEPFFQLPHLMAERADGQVHRRRRARQVAEPGGGHETLQGMERWAGHQA